MRYFPASVRVLPVPRNADHQLWLARGDDRAGNSYVNVVDGVRVDEHRDAVATAG